MTNGFVAKKGHHYVLAVVAAVLLLPLLGLLFAPTISAATNEPEQSGSKKNVFTRLEIAQSNDFRVYAKPGETIHVTVYSGVGLNTPSSGDSKYCNKLSILNGNGSEISAATDSITVSGIKASGDTFEKKDSTTPTTGTCAGDNNDGKPYTTVTLNYTVPSGYTIASLNDAFIVRFAKDTKSGDNNVVQGYEWRVAVSGDAIDPLKDIKSGRVWVVPSKSGLRVWQRAANNNLTTNATNHKFRYVRQDGYRYTVEYTNYHGMWSTFHGGVYGARSFTTGKPVYQSYGTIDNTNFEYTLASDVGAELNIAYIFVDCDWSTIDGCPSDLVAITKDANNGKPLLRSQPITSEQDKDINGALVTDSSGNPVEGNPVGPVNAEYNATTGFRYTGYKADDLTHATSGVPVVTIPYTAMQTGYLRLTISAKKSTASLPVTLCTKDIMVDDSDGSGEKEWKMQSNSSKSSADISCDGGTLVTGSPISLNPASDTLTITVQAIHLGEMHFIDVDTEQRGGIAVTGNGLGTQEQKRGIIWYDYFKRGVGATCGKIPPLSGKGAPGNANQGSGDWASASTDPASVLGSSRLPVDSSGSVHGWLSDDACEATSGAGGYANDDGTASAKSTWGNNRVVEDWTYAFQDPHARELRLGGPNYKLLPSVTPSSATITPGQSATFTPGVSKSGSSTASGIHWEIAKVVVAPGYSVNKSLFTASGTAGVCAHYAGVGITCTPPTPSQQGTDTFPDKTLNPFTDNDTAGLAIGSQLCYALLVSPYTQDGNNYSQAISCVTVAASPYVSVVGGSVWAGGSTDVTNNYAGPGVKITGKASGSVFGSFGEYGVFATGQISSFGSAGHVGLTAPASGKGAQLTFGSIGSLGVFSNSHQIVNLAAQYSSAPHTETVLSNAPGGKAVNASGVYRVSSDITVMSISSGKNPRAVIYAPENTVTIAGDLRYTYAGAASFKELPSLTIIAKKIIIADGVGEIAGNYYATEQFVTCSNGPITKGASGAISAAGACSKSLVINGTVTVANQAAGSLVLNRSYGGTTTGQPAEVIKMRPESVLTPYENSLTFTTVYETELPARY